MGQQLHCPRGLPGQSLETTADAPHELSVFHMEFWSTPKGGINMLIVIGILLVMVVTVAVAWLLGKWAGTY